MATCQIAFCGAVNDVRLLTTCGHNICEKCMLELQRANTLKCPLDRVPITSVQEYCKIHKKNEAHYYCQPCAHSVCHSCLLDDSGLHRNHAYISMESEIEQTSAHVRKFVGQAAENLKSYVNETSSVEIEITDSISEFKEALVALQSMNEDMGSTTTSQKAYTEKFRDHVLECLQKGDNARSNARKHYEHIGTIVSNLQEGLANLEALRSNTTVLFAPAAAKQTQRPASVSTETADVVQSQVIPNEHGMKKFKELFEMRLRKSLVFVGSGEPGTHGLVRYNSLDWKILVHSNALDEYLVRTRFCAVSMPALTNRLFILGGILEGKASRAMQIYDLGTEELTTSTPMAEAAYNFGATAVGNNIYTSGGRSSTGAVLRDTWAYSFKNQQWDRTKRMNHSRTEHTVACLGGFVYAVGGEDETSLLHTIERYDCTANVWTLLSPMPFSLKSPSVVAVGENYLYVCGGRSKSGPTNILWRFDSKTNTWEVLASMGTCRYGASMVLIGRELVVMGGVGTENIIERYNLDTTTWRQDHQLIPGSGIAFAHALQLY